ncbi:MAG: NAD-dependent epimerase/dehydratase family protein [Allorhizobium sp.]
MKIAVTGATGYIGTRFSQIAQKNGHEIVALSRRKPVDIAAWVPFDIAQSGRSIELPSDVDAVIHLAAALSTSAAGPMQEVEAAKALIEAAKRKGIPFVFVSSQTARADAPTPYGQTKWEIERLVLAAAGIVARPGQVYGGTEQALFGTLVKLVRTLPVLPLFIPAPNVQPIHVDDLSEALLRCAQGAVPAGSIVHLGMEEPIAFHRFLSAIASVRLRKRKFLIPVPTILIGWAARLLGPSLAAKVGLERITSLLSLRPMRCRDDLAQLEISLRGLDAGMHPSGDDRRRRLVQEGRSLLTYVLKVPPRSALLRRYVRCLEYTGRSAPIPLARSTRRFPISLAFYERKGMLSTELQTEFSWRLDAATVLAEASIQGAARFIGDQSGSGFVLTSLKLGKTVLLEAVLRLLVAISLPVMKSIAERREVK